MGRYSSTCQMHFSKSSRTFWIIPSVTAFMKDRKLYLTPSIVRDVAAMFVDTTHFLMPVGAGKNMLFCWSKMTDSQTIC